MIKRVCHQHQLIEHLPYFIFFKKYVAETATDVTFCLESSLEIGQLHIICKSTKSVEYEYPASEVGLIEQP